MLVHDFAVREKGEGERERLGQGETSGREREGRRGGGGEKGSLCGCLYLHV